MLAVTPITLGDAYYHILAESGITLTRGTGIRLGFLLEQLETLGDPRVVGYRTCPERKRNFVRRLETSIRSRGKILRMDDLSSITDSASLWTANTFFSLIPPTFFSHYVFRQEQKDLPDISALAATSIPELVSWETAHHVQKTRVSIRDMFADIRSAYDRLLDLPPNILQQFIHITKDTHACDTFRRLLYAHVAPSLMHILQQHPRYDALHTLKNDLIVRLGTSNTVRDVLIYLCDGRHTPIYANAIEDQLWQIAATEPDAIPFELTEISICAQAFDTYRDRLALRETRKNIKTPHDL